jgi:hypothetical protein
MIRVGIIPSVRPLIGIGLATTAVLGVLDAGSIVLAQIAVPDDVRRAGQIAAAAVDGQPANRQTARTAFDAAQAEARQHGLAVQVDGFTIYPDGRVALTAGKTAPTLLLKHIEPLSHYAEITSTVTVEKLPYS